MKKLLQLILVLILGQPLFAQEWVTALEDIYLPHEQIAVDGGDNILHVGTLPEQDGCVLKVDKKGEYIIRKVHLPGKALEYHSAIELDNGNYMVFGICDDSLADYHYQRYLQVDVFDSQLESVSSRTYDMDDELTDLFNFPNMRHPMSSIVTPKGTVLLAAAPSIKYSNNYGYYYQSVLRFFEFDEEGALLRIVDNPRPMTELGDIKSMTYAPRSDNLMVFVGDGIFGNASGVPGILVADTSYTIVAKQSLYALEGLGCSDIGCDGHWIDDQHLIVDVEQYIGQSFTFHTLYKVDSALNVYGSQALLPSDSCTWVSRERNTAYANDSTIFAFSYFSDSFSAGVLFYSNACITLFDKHLNLLGRKVIKKDDMRHNIGVPAVFNDGGCLVHVRSWNGENFQGEPFDFQELMKFRREDIEITWDVVNETEAEHAIKAYPNPTSGILNIPIGETDCQDARLQIFDMKGAKCFDCALSKQGNLITVDTQNLEAGLYVYHIISGSKELADGKFVKE